MPGRTRTRTKSHYKYGKAERWSPKSVQVYVKTVDEERGWPTHRSTCTDVVGNRFEDNNFSLEKETWNMVGLTGTSQNLGTRKYTDYPGATLGGTYTPDHCRSLGLPSDTVALTQALARADPDRAQVDLPIALAEMREAPGLIKDYGDLLIKKIRHRRYRGFTDSARQNLAWQFGLKPMISDLRKLMDFKTGVEKRAEEIKKIWETGGLRKRVTLRENEIKNEFNPKVAMDSILSDVIYRNRQRTTVVNQWATFRFKPKLTNSFITDDRVYELATKAVLGLEADANTAWNLIPWTWLLGWFSTTSDYVQLSRNIIPCYCNSGCLMTQISTTERYASTPTSNDFARGLEGTIRLETKRRFVGTVPVLEASIPFLDTRQTSILGSLAISKSSRLANSL